MNKGQKFHGRGFILAAHKNNSNAQFAFVASKKVGKAVRRNRAIRLLRNAVQHEFEKESFGYDYVFIARKGLDTWSLERVEKELRFLQKQLSKQGRM